MKKKTGNLSKGIILSEMIGFGLVPVSYMAVLGHPRPVSGDRYGWNLLSFANAQYMDLKLIKILGLLLIPFPLFF